MKTIICMTTLILSITSCSEKQAGNPLLEHFTTPHQTPPFDRIETRHYEPAFDRAIEEAKQEIKAISTSAEAPDFENTIVALDQAGEKLSTISSIFFNLNSACTNEEMQQIAQRISPKLTEYGNSVYMNPELFARVKKVYESRDRQSLTPEQSTLLEDTWKSFIKGGANLESAAQKRFQEIAMELSQLGLKFDENTLAETNGFTLHITDEKDLAGLPEGAVEMAAMTAKEKELEGWLFTLHAPSYIPFMKYADNRELREKMYRAYASRGNRDNQYDNKEVIRKMVTLRLEKAQLLGYPTYAEYVLTDRMAQNTEMVNTFLGQLLAASHPHALAEKQEVEEFARRQGFKGELQRWDWAYYSNKLKQEKYALDDEMLKPYFKLENVREGAFAVANKLYGITLNKLEGIPTYHPDVEVFEVKDADGSQLGIFYVDYFPRSGKSGGAWMSNYREQQGATRPLVCNVCSFTKPVGDTPSLLTMDEVETLFHEFGHALHGLLTKCEYKGTSGTNVVRDFVELPSQINEHWATEPEVLKMYAKHYQTGEVIPDEIIEKILKQKTFNQGFMTTELLAAAILDMNLHMITDVKNLDMLAFEKEAMDKLGLIPEIAPRYRVTYFNHIIGGYAAGYYSYLWANVLDNDAFEAFKEHGIFDKNTADLFRYNVLEKGDSEDPMILYKNFRGAEPSLEPLLKNRGMK